MIANMPMETTYKLRVNGKKAILGDQHGNDEALDAVLEDISKRNKDGADINNVLCTGDLLGYGPNPRHCVKVAYEHWKAGNWISARGNHDLAASNLIKDPKYPVGPSTGIVAPGGYEGLYLAARNLCGDFEPIPSRPIKPKRSDGKEAREAYDKSLVQWKEHVVAHTTKAINYAHSQECIDDIAKGLDGLKSNFDLKRTGRFGNLSPPSVRQHRTGSCRPRDT